MSQWWWEQAGIELEGAKNMAAEAATVSESESDSESNAYPGGEEEVRGASGSSGVEWIGVGRKSTPPPRRTTGRNHGRAIK